MLVSALCLQNCYHVLSWNFVYLKRELAVFTLLNFDPIAFPACFRWSTKSQTSARNLMYLFTKNHKQLWLWYSTRLFNIFVLIQTYKNWLILILQDKNIVLTCHKLRGKLPFFLVIYNEQSFWVLEIRLFGRDLDITWENLSAIGQIVMQEWYIKFRKLSRNWLREKRTSILENMRRTCSQHMAMISLKMRFGGKICDSKVWT